MNEHFEEVNKFRFVFLDGLRGLAALVVLLYHRRWWIGDGALFYSGYLAVDFFFCLSGFVISYAYDDRLKSISFWGFCRERLVRLYPMIAAGVVIGAIVLVGKGALYGEYDKKKYAEIALALFGLPSFWNHPDVFPVNGPLWSIFFELVINAIYASVLVSRGTGLLVVFAVLLFGYVAVAADHVNGIGQLGFTTSTFMAGFARSGFSFIVGLVLSRWARDGRLPRLRVPAGFLVGVLACVLISGPWSIGAYAKDLLCIALIFPVIVALGSRTKISKAAAGLAGELGQISYPLYAVHYPLYAVFGRFLGEYLTGSALLICAVGLIVVISAAFAHLYEAPAIRRLKAAFR